MINDKVCVGTQTRGAVNKEEDRSWSKIELHLLNYCNQTASCSTAKCKIIQKGIKNVSNIE